MGFVTLPLGPRIVAMGFGAAASPMLRRLEQAIPLASIRWPGDAPGESPATKARQDHSPSARWLEREWPLASAVLAVGACGLVTRLIAPLLGDKASDPAVVVVDPEGRFAIPLLGGHGAGGERLSQEIAALLGGEAVLTGSSSALGHLALDDFGHAWGWQRGAGDWKRLMIRAATDRGPIPVGQDCGSPIWRELQAASWLEPSSIEAGNEPDAARFPLVISHRSGAGCRWHPPCLWLGMGCERGTSLTLLERLVEQVLSRHGLAEQAVAGLASVDIKGDEAALLALANRRGWPLRLFSATELAQVRVPHPSAVVAREIGTGSVAEAGALVAAARYGGDRNGGQPRLLVEKTIETRRSGERGAGTLAVALAADQWAPNRGEIHLVGSGPGRLDLLSGDARNALAAATVWIGYGPYLDLLEPLRRPDQLRRDGRLTEERGRCEQALDLATQGLKVALISSGDSGIYGMAGLALELWLARADRDRPPFTVHPGLSALQLAAARVGAPLTHDFCAISLSDRLTPWEVIERRVRAAAEADFVVAFYNPRSRERHWQLGRARDLLLESRAATTPVVVARQLGRAEESTELHCLADLPLDMVDMLTLVLVGNSTSFTKDGWMVTPRGYPGASLA